MGCVRERRVRRIVVWLGLLVASCFPCGAQEAIQVGIVLPLSGPQSFFGTMEKEAFDLALEEINAAGGVRGRPLQFLFDDDRGQPAHGAAVARRLVEERQVVMLGGGYSSAVTSEIAEFAQQARVPFLINTGAADSITERGWEYVFRLNPPSSEYVASAIDLLRQVVRPRTAALIYENTAFGRSQAASFEKACRELGIKTTVKQSYDHAEFKLWRVMQILLQVRRAKPDVVYMVSYLTDASLIMRQARALSWAPKLYMGGAAGFTLPEFYELTNEDAEGVMTVTLWHQTLPYPGAQEFFDKFKARYARESDYHGAEAYAAAYVIADALGRAEDLTAEAIRNALVETDLMTAFGPVKFLSAGGKTNQNRLPTYVGQWIDGRLELVWPETAARTRYRYPVPRPN